MKTCLKLWNKLCDLMILKEPPVNYDFSWATMIEEAQADLKEARNLFLRADDPDMIDYATFNLKAAEKRYDYILKKVKEQQAEKLNKHDGIHINEL